MSDPIAGPCTYCGSADHWRPDCPAIRPIDWEDWQRIPEGRKWDAYHKQRSEIERLNQYHSAMEDTILEQAAEIERLREECELLRSDDSSVVAGLYKEMEHQRKLAEEAGAEIERLRDEQTDSLSKWNQVQSLTDENQRLREALKQAIVDLDTSASVNSLPHAEIVREHYRNALEGNDE